MLLAKELGISCSHQLELTELLPGDSTQSLSFPEPDMGLMKGESAHRPDTFIWLVGATRSVDAPSAHHNPVLAGGVGLVRGFTPMGEAELMGAAVLVVLVALRPSNVPSPVCRAAASCAGASPTFRVPSCSLCLPVLFLCCKGLSLILCINPQDVLLHLLSLPISLSPQSPCGPPKVWLSPKSSPGS